jgi:thiamine pyrophosphate-dependent acetolactate synthase large subunit-like protein
MSTGDVERLSVANTLATLEWGSDAAAQMLRALDIPYVALNPGSSTRGFHDSLVNFLGNVRPQLLLCLHEEHAVAIAHGYAKVTGRPLAVAVHGNVGLMHATMAIFNAFCDRVPMVVLGSNGPLDAAQRRPWIDWIHTTADNATLVRDYVKWDDQPGSPRALAEAIVRGAQLSATSPAAPVYIAMDVAIQEQKLAEGVSLPDVAQFAPLPDPEPAPEAVNEVAARLERAQHPVILAGRVGRSESAWAQRVLLAEHLGARVITDLRAAAAFPTDHPLHVGIPGYVLSRAAADALSDADVILSLDWIDLAGTLAQASTPREGRALVFSASVDDYLHRGWSKDHQAPAPADLRLTTTSDIAVARLASRLGLSRLGPPTRRELKVSASRERPTLDPDSLPTLLDLVQELHGALEGHPVCLTRVPLGWDGRMTHFRHALDFLGYDGGGGLGSGPGITVGAALALRDDPRIAVGVLGDGDFTMGMSALWTAAKYQLPLLIVVANNESYFNDELHQDRIARRRGRPTENRWIGQRTTEPGIDCAALARGQGLMGIGPVQRVGEMDEALRTAVRTVQAGKPVLVDVHVARDEAAAAADIAEP